MNAITEKMIPRCFGRYLIDLPESFVLNTEGGQKIDGVTIDIRARSEAEFNQGLDARRRVLESQTLLLEPKITTLKEILPLPNGRGVIFDRAENQFSNLFRTLELMDWRDGYQIKMEIDARDRRYSEEKYPEGTVLNTTPKNWPPCSRSTIAPAPVATKSPRARAPASSTALSRAPLQAMKVCASSII
jgi:hypothetical protein